MTEIKEYTFFIDESGPFDGTKSMIGGILCPTEHAVEPAATAIIERIRAPYLADEAFYKTDRDPKFPDRDVQMNFRHATQLPFSIRTEVKLAMLSAIRAAGYRMIVFQPEHPIKVSNTSETYLVFLSEGITRVMQMLSDDGPFRLSVVIGERVDTGEKNKGRGTKGKSYLIQETDIRREITKSLTLSKALHPERYHRTSLLKNIQLKNDKHDDRLALSDYVVNGWFTKDSFSRTPESHAQFKEIKDAYTHLTLRSEPVHITIQKALDHRDVTQALFLAMGASENVYRRKESIAAVQAALQGMRQVSLKAEMTAYLRKFESIINVQRACHQAIRLIDETIAAIATPEIMRSYLPEFLANLLLWKMGACTHLGDVAGYHAAEAICKEQVRAAHDVDLYLIYMTYRINHLQSLLAYEESLRAGDEVLDVLRLLRAPTKALEEKTGIAFVLYGERYAKICGALVSACTHQAALDPAILARGRALSAAAIESFVLQDDKDRQYQLRAELESVCGEHAEAIRYLEQALHFSLSDPKEERYARFTPFEWYHFSKILAHLFAAGGAFEKIAGQAFHTALPHWKRYQKTIASLDFPDIVTYTHLGICYAKTGNIDVGRKLVQQACHVAYAYGTADVFLIGMMEHAVDLALLALERPLTRADIEPLQFKALENDEAWPFDDVPPLLQTFEDGLEAAIEDPDAARQHDRLLTLSHLADF